jgi:hypothetical protein
MADPAPAPAPTPSPAPAVQLDARAQQELAELMVDMSHDKEMRPLVNKFLKKKNGKVLPDVELEEIRAENKREFEKRDIAASAEREKLRLEAQRNALIESGRFSEDDVKKMEKDVMEKHGISDYNVAAKVFAADVKPADPTPEISSRNWELPKFSKEEMANPHAVARRRANDVVGEIMRNRKRAHA